MKITKKIGGKEWSNHASRPVSDFNHFEALDMKEEIQMAHFYPPTFDKNSKILHCCQEYKGEKFESVIRYQDLTSP
jgi:hypothetical protein